MLPGMMAVMLVGGSAGGVVPAAVTWDDINGAGIGSGSNAAREITGIGEPIQLRALISATAVLNGGAGTVEVYTNGLLSGLVGIADGFSADVTVVAGDDVAFFADGDGDGGWEVSCTVTIKYKSAGSPTFDQTLDAFDVTLSGFSL